MVSCLVDLIEILLGFGVPNLKETVHQPRTVLTEQIRGHGFEAFKGQAHISLRGSRGLRGTQQYTREVIPALRPFGTNRTYRLQRPAAAPVSTPSECSAAGRP